MNQRKIDGNLYQSLLLCGLNNLKANIKTVNDLNVFPIPDGDTGFNMYSTFSGGCRIADAAASLGETAENVGNGMLLSARGNSGVILSQMFAGIASGLKGVQDADVALFGRAFGSGVQCAYDAVAEPVEGTMLTVLREAAEYAVGRIDGESTVESFFSDLVYETERSLERTPDLLPVLKEAGVVDSGGAGVFFILQGILNALRGEAEAVESAAVTSDVKETDFSLFDENTEMKYGYCTEFLLRLSRRKTDIDEFSLTDFKAGLIELGGESLVAIKTGTIVKIHVHTMRPWEVMRFAQSFGEFLTVKVENMMLQHNETAAEKKPARYKKNAVRKKFGVIAVANGEGMKDAFTELGADAVIDGSEANPPVEEFLQAIEAVNADCVFILPDSGNEKLAAQGAAAIFKDSEVRVIESKNMGDIYAALSSLDLEAGDADAIEKNIYSDMQGTVAASVSVAVRSAKCGDVDVKEGEYVGFTGKEMLVSNPDKMETVTALMQKLGAGEKEFLVVFYGKNALPAERRKFAEYVNDNYPSAEFYELDGEQELYDFIIVLQ